tara:strand:- start:1106 stop:2905 length:1800 start_codon:yes stop_codon:yes gene_type:complete
MKVKNIKSKLEEIGIDLQNDIALGDFDLIGEYTARKNRDRNSRLYRTAGSFFRPNYERGILIYSLIKQYKIKSFLEIGFGRGYASFCAAMAFEQLGIDGKIISVDPFFSQKQEYIQNLRQVLPSTWFDKITFINQKSSDFLPKVQKDFDLIFIDGDHSYDAVKKDWEYCKDKFTKFLIFDDYHIPPKNDPGIQVTAVVDNITGYHKEAILMDRRIFKDDRGISDDQLKDCQVLITKNKNKIDLTEDDPNLERMLEFCEKRASEWPKRENNYENFIDYMDILETSVKEETLSLPELDSKDMRESNVFILGAMKSGTSLMLNILDGHEDMLCLPVDSHLMKHYNLESMSNQAVYDKLHNLWFRKLISPTGQSPFLTFGNDINNYVGFSRHLMKIFDVDNLGGFKSFDIAANAYFNSCPFYKGRKPGSVVEKTPENEFYLDQIRKGFDNPKFIHIVRNPIVNLASLKQNALDLGYDYNPSQGLQSILNSHEIARRNANNSDYIVLRYEDVVNDLSESLTRLCNFLKIDLSTTLEEPTFLGEKVKSNSVHDELASMQGIYKRSQKDDTERSKRILGSDYDKILEFFRSNQKVIDLLSEFNYEI